MHSVSGQKSGRSEAARLGLPFDTPPLTPSGVGHRGQQASWRNALRRILGLWPIGGSVWGVSLVPGWVPWEGPWRNRQKDFWLGCQVAGRRGRPLTPDYKPGFGWASLGLGIIVAAVVVIALVPERTMNGLVHGPTPLSLTQPDVLVVSPSDTDQAAVIQTVTPRGYTVRLAAGIDAGLETLRSEPSRVGIVLVDGDLPKADAMIKAVKASCPTAKLIVISDGLQPAAISTLLVNTGLR